MFSVYEIMVKGVSYIGYTSKPIEERFINHYKSAVKNTDPNKLLYQKIREVWETDPTYEPYIRLLYESDNRAMALLHEVKYIREKNVIQDGLNCTRGGEYASGHVTDIATPEQVREVLGISYLQFRAMFRGPNPLNPKKKDLKKPNVNDVIVFYKDFFKKRNYKKFIIKLTQIRTTIKRRYNATKQIQS